MTTGQKRASRVNTELQEMIDREVFAASVDAYRKLGRADSRTAIPVEVVGGRLKGRYSGSAFDEFLALADKGEDFAILQNSPRPLQGFAKFDPEKGIVYELKGLAPNQTRVMKDLSGFGVPVTPGLFLSQNQVAGTGKILQYPQSPKMPEEYIDVIASSNTLRPAQREAVRKLNADMSFIWGPPGTGKTYTISQVILEIARQGGKVLVTSTADKAVKGALNALTKLNRPPVCEFLEDSDPKNDPHREYDKNIKASRGQTDKEKAAAFKEAAEQALRDAAAIFANSLRLVANRSIIAKTGRPTHIIVDEVSMMTVMMVSLIKNSFPGAKLILVGDPNQLSPVVIDSTVARSDYGKNIYQLVGLDNPELSKPENFVTFLDQTSRMPARLTQAISNKWYRGALKSTREIGQFTPLCNGQPEVVYDFEGIPDQGLSFPEPRCGWKNSNKTDAQTVVKVAKIALDNQREVMIVSPYTGQVSLINHYLKANNLNERVQATTVHKAQGAEADIVIWSVVADNPHFNKPGNSQADMIATVALSRAKQQVFIVGAQQGTVAYDFIKCYDQLGSAAPQASTPTPEVSVEVSNTPELTPDEEYRNELTANAAEEFFAEDNSTAFETIDEPISAYVSRCHYYQDWFDWNNLDALIWEELQKDGVCTQKTNSRWTEPRLTAWFSEDNTAYEYSGIEHQSQGWPDWVEKLAQGVKEQYGTQYHKPNSVLVNVYRDGNDYVSMHRDDEPLFDNTQPIASISLGATRAFNIGTSRLDVSHTVNLEDKSLLLMLPGFQDRYWHGVPREPDLKGTRINLTFRYVKPQEKSEYNGPTTVVNLNNNEDYDVYIGRAGRGLDGYFGNPIVRGEKCCVCGDKHFNNESIVACYRKRFYRMIEEDEVFAERISQLKGKRLGCFCKPDHCHGDVIADYLESPEDTGSDLSFEPAPVAPQSQPEVITFSKTKEPYGEFGNMASGYPIRTHGGAVWPTREHLYQACKFQDEDIRRQIYNEKNAYLMKKNIARPNEDKVRPDWEQIKDEVMEWCVASKLVQHQDSVRKTLRSTGNAIIVECSSKDHYWGASKVNGQWQGHNKLGRLLMYLRDNPRYTEAIAIRGPHPAYKRNEPEDFTPALAYAGIGARKTPGEVLQYMTQQATLLESMNCLLRTGDAEGADQAFCNGAKYKSVYTPKQPILDWAREKVAEVCDSDYNTYKPITQNLLARNMYQLFGDGDTPDACYPSKFVLYWSKPSSGYNLSQQDNYFNCSGGTRYAVRAAVKAGIPTFNLYNQKELWEQYRDNGFEFPESPKVVEQVVEPNVPTPEPERDMTKVLKDRAELLEYVMQLHNREDKA